MAGLTPEGFVPKRLPQIIEELKSRAELQFGDLVGEGDVVNTSDNSLIGRLIGLISVPYSDLWEASEQSYSSLDPLKASGNALDNAVFYGGVTRKAATPTSATLHITGDVGTVIPLGSEVNSDVNSSVFITQLPLTINVDNAVNAVVRIVDVLDNTDYILTLRKVPAVDTSPSITVTYNSGVGATLQSILEGLRDEVITNASSIVDAEIVDNFLHLNGVDSFQEISFVAIGALNFSKATNLAYSLSDTTGPIEQPRSTLTNIVTPVTGWDSVNNPSAGILGNDRETDDQLRERFIRSKSVDASYSYEAIYSAVDDVEGVTDIAVFENDTDETQILPPYLPPHSFMVVVEGGSSQQIAKAIFDNKPFGILSYGTTTVVVNDSRGIPHEVSFSRPTPVSVKIVLNITVQDGFSAYGVEEIKDNLMRYFEDQQSIGTDVILSRLYTPINQVRNHYVTSLLISKETDVPASANIPIAQYEFATLTRNNISVIVS